MSTLYISQIFQIVICVFLVILVMIQAKGTGLTSAIGSSISFYRSRRGLEKSIFVASILSGIMLVLNSLALVLLR